MWEVYGVGDGADDVRLIATAMRMSLDQRLAERIAAMRLRLPDLLVSDQSFAEFLSDARHRESLINDHPLNPFLDALESNASVRTELFKGTPLRRWMETSYVGLPERWTPISYHRRYIQLRAQSWSPVTLRLYKLPQLLGGLLSESYHHRNHRIRLLADAVGGTFELPRLKAEAERFSRLIEDVQWVDAVQDSTSASSERAPRSSVTDAAVDLALAHLDERDERESSPTPATPKDFLSFVHDAVLMIWSDRHGSLRWAPSPGHDSSVENEGWEQLWLLVRRSLSRRPSELVFLQGMLESVQFDLACVLDIERWERRSPSDALRGARSGISIEQVEEKARRRQEGLFTCSEEEAPLSDESRKRRSVGGGHFLTPGAWNKAKSRVKKSLEAVWLWSWRHPRWFEPPTVVSIPSISDAARVPDHLLEFYPRLEVLRSREATVDWCKTWMKGDPRPTEEWHKRILCYRLLESTSKRRQSLVSHVLKGSATDVQIDFHQLVSPLRLSERDAIVFAVYGGYGCLASLVDRLETERYEECRRLAERLALGPHFEGDTSLALAQLRNSSSDTPSPEWAVEVYHAVDDLLKLPSRNRTRANVSAFEDKTRSTRTVAHVSTAIEGSTRPVGRSSRPVR